MTASLFSISAIRAAAATDNYWWSAGSMRFFGTRASSKCFVVSDGTLFVTSERPPFGPRAYAVNFAHNGSADERGSVERVSGVCAYASRNGALAAAERLGKSWRGIGAEQDDPRTPGSFGDAR